MTGSHFLFSLEKPRDTREWVIPELYLFVMVACGTALIEAFPLRSLVFAVGLIGMLGGAAAAYIQDKGRSTGPESGEERKTLMTQAAARS